MPSIIHHGRATQHAIALEQLSYSVVECALGFESGFPKSLIGDYIISFVRIFPCFRKMNTEARNVLFDFQRKLALGKIRQDWARLQENCV